MRKPKPGEWVRMPCAAKKWERVVAVRDLSTPDHVCWAIDCENGHGHGGETPLEVRTEPPERQP
jgi:hypothetical protein